MMNQGTSFLKRFFALVMALALLVSGSNLGAVLQVSAAEAETITAGEIVANNYELTEAEKNLLSSGLLAGEVISYTVPADSGLITVDTENAKITAANEGEWIPVSAEIIANSAVVETVALVDGEGNYNPAVGNAFSVKVKYVLNKEVAVADQTNLLNAAMWLKADLASLKAIYGISDTNLGTVLMAMDILNDLEAGYLIDFLGSPITLRFDVAAQEAVAALNAELAANDDQLALQKLNAQYAASASKVQFLVNNGAAMKAAAEATLANLAAIKNDALLTSDMLDFYLQGYDAAGYTQWRAFKSILGNLVTGLETALAAEWNALNNAVVKADITAAECVTLDALLAAVTEHSAFAVKNPLLIAEAFVQANLSMFNVTVKVVMNNVVDAADSAELEETVSAPVVLTLAAGASAEEVAAEAAEVIEAALASWAAYAEGKFDVTATELPAALDADIEYVVTYAPKTFTVSYGYTTDAPSSVPYGYQMTLPLHPVAEQAFDYTVNGEPYAQGEIVTIEGDTTIARAAGKAYATTTLYNVIADNYADAVVKAILESGALTGDEAIAVRKPDPADAASLLELLDGTLTAATYPAAYNGLIWAPYTYGNTGAENLFSGNTAAWAGKSVKVQYKLDLSNFSAAQVAGILELAAQLKVEYVEQKGAMDSLAGLEDTLVQLDKTKLGALNGVIDVTDFTEGDGTDTDAENIAIRAELKSIVSAIIANNLDTNNYLKIYNIVKTYNVDGMAYYYQNFDAIKAEVNSLSGYMSNLMDNEAALRVMCNAAGYGEYADKIADVETQLNDYNARLSAPNAAIDVNGGNLGKLIAALEIEGEATYATAGVPYMLSDVLTAMDESQVMVQIIGDVNGKSFTVATEAMDRNTLITAEMINNLKAAAAAEAAKLADIKYYTLNVEGDLDALVGTELKESFNAYYFYSVKEFVVEIEGEDDQIVTINDLEINLPKHPTNGFKYEYTVDGVSGLTNATYTFTLEQIDALFVDGVYTITRVEINEADEKLEGSTFADWMVKDADGNLIGLKAVVEGNQGSVMDFVMDIVNAGYTYIGLNGEPLLYLAADDSLEISLQTLINAVLADDQFGSENLINLGKNGKGEFVHASMQLGNAADDIHFEDLDFVLYLNSVPGQMTTVANGLETVKPYMTFNSNDGVMDINLTLPEKVYEVYLAAMLATGNVTKDNLNEINDDIAFQFFYDYIEVIINSDASTTSFTNTLSMLGQSYDLTGYEKYYQMVKGALTNPGVAINTTEDDEFLMTASGKSKSAIDSLINLLGVDISAYSTYLGMIKEYKYEDATLGASARANLVNTDSGFEAALIDVNASGAANKFDFTKDLPARCSSIANTAAVILLDTVDGNLVFNGTTILDLNGQTVNGSITSNGTLIIVDSFLGTNNGGHVTGAVSGNVTIIAGTYDADVTRYLKDGYKQVSGSVQNALFTVESDGNDVTYVINTNVMSDETVENYVPNVRALAVEIAVDLVLNYYTTAALAAEGNSLYNLHIADLIGLYASSNKVDDLIQVVLDCVNLPELSNFTNIMLADMLDFGAMADALENNEALATYTMATTPWAVNVSYVEDGDYVTVGIGSNTMNNRVGKTFDVALKFTGSNKDRVVDELRELGEIVDASAEVNLAQPIYAGASNSLYLEGSSSASVTLNLNMKDVYANILAVILANGNADVKDALVAAVNAGDREALKDIIDEMTVADLIAAMKALNRNESIAAVASKLGVTANVTDDTYLEKAAHLMLTALGKVLDELDITGMNSKFGALDADDDGIYEFAANASRKPNASARGYSVYVEASIDVSLTVNLFGEPCKLGDVDHDGDVDTFDAAYVLQYYVGNPLDIDFCTYGADVDGDGDIDTFDAAYILQFYVGNISKFPAEN